MTRFLHKDHRLWSKNHHLTTSKWCQWCLTLEKMEIIWNNSILCRDHCTTPEMCSQFHCPPKIPTSSGSFPEFISNPLPGCHGAPVVLHRRCSSPWRHPSRDFPDCWETVKGAVPAAFCICWRHDQRSNSANSLGRSHPPGSAQSHDQTPSSRDCLARPLPPSSDWTTGQTSRSEESLANPHHEGSGWTGGQKSRFEDWMERSHSQGCCWSDHQKQCF